MKIDEIKKCLISSFNWTSEDFSHISDSTIDYFYSLGLAKKVPFDMYIDWYGFALLDILELGFMHSNYFDWKKEGF